MGTIFVFIKNAQLEKGPFLVLALLLGKCAQNQAFPN